MAESPAFTAHPLIEPAADPERFRRAFATLRAEFQAETDAAKKAAVAFELAKLHAKLDETAHAAREALQATNLASAFVEPVEMLIAISREKNSRGNLRKLLERLEKIATSAELRVRATLELCALCEAEGDVTEARARATSFLEEFGEESEHAGPFLWLLERLAAERHDDAEVARLARARARLLSTPELRAELLERASRAFERIGNTDAAIEMLREAERESASDRRAVGLRRRLTLAGRLEEARALARSSLERTGDAPPLERAAALFELFATAPLAVSDEDLGDLADACRSAVPAPDLLLVALLATFAKLRERTDLFSEALDLAERCPLDPADRAVLAVIRGLAGGDSVDRAFELARAVDLLPGARVPKAGLLLGIAGRPRPEAFDDALGARLGAPAAIALARAIHERLTFEDASSSPLEALPPNERARFEAFLAGSGAATVPTKAGELFSSMGRALPPSEDSFDSLDAPGVGFLRLLFGERAPGRGDLVGALVATEREAAPDVTDRGAGDLALARTLLDHHRTPGEATRSALLAHAEADPEDPLALGIGLALARESSPLRSARLLSAAAEAARRRGDVEASCDLAERSLVASLEAASLDAASLDAARLPRDVAEAAERALSASAADRHPLVGYLLARLLGGDGAAARRLLTERADWNEAFRLREALEGRVVDPSSGEPPRVLTVPLERVVSPAAARWLRALASPAVDAEGRPIDPASLLRDGAGRLPEAHLAFLSFRARLVSMGGFSALEDGALARELLPLVRAWKEACDNADSSSAPDPETRTEARLAWLTVALAAGAEFEADRAIDELLPSGESDGEPTEETLFAAWGRESPGFTATRVEAAARVATADDDDLQLFRAYGALIGGDARSSLDLFARLAEKAPSDPAVLEGLRRAAERAGDRTRELEALTALAQSAPSDQLAAELWETAGRLHLDPRTDGTRDLAQAEECYSAALARDPERTSAYAMLYRIVRARGDHARLIELLDARLEQPLERDSFREVLWEKAQLCRKLGRRAALDRTLSRLLDEANEPLPALALAAELRLSDGRTGDAASLLAKIARHPETGDDERETAGVHALALFHGLSRPSEVFELSETLLELGVPEARLREPRARAAAELGKWDVAYRCYRDLSDESDDVELRSLASKMMLVLQRDHLRHRGAIEDAARRVLRDDATDAEAIDVVLSGDFSSGDRRFLLGPTLAEAKAKLAKSPLDGTLLRRYVEVAIRSEIPEEIRLGLGLRALVSEEPGDPAEGEGEARPFVPTRALTPDEQRALLPPAWDEPTGVLAVRLGRVLTPLVSPSLESLGLSVSMRVDPFSSSELRAELSSLAGLFGLVDFELYVGGSDPLRIAAFDRDFPSLALGRSIRAPLAGLGAVEAGLALFTLRYGLAPFLGASDEDLLPWAKAFLDPTSDPERGAHFVDEAPLSGGEAIRGLVGRFAGRGGLPEHLLRLVRVALARTIVFLHGDASVLKRLSRFLPLETEARIAVLSEAIRFSLSEEFLALRRKAGLEA